MLSTKLKAAAGNSADATLYVDDVFSTYLYTGNGSTQTITNGIDLAGKGGMVWWKGRSAGAAYTHLLFDTNRGVNTVIVSNGTGADISLVPSLTSFNSNGFAIGGTGAAWNGSGESYVSWTFRKAAKFFDVVTYTGTGSARTIAHSLGVAPGMVIVKRTDTSSDWQVYHRSLTSAAYSIQLNLTAAQASASTVWNSTAPTSSVFSVGTDATVNASGGTYVAYLFAHDTSSTGIIQCGSFNTPSSAGDTTVTLGWQPQYVLVKRIDGSGGDWFIQDTMRGMVAYSLTGEYLIANLTSAASSSSIVSPLGNGFISPLNVLATSSTYIYMAIRVSNKPPTTGTQVYYPVARSGTGATGASTVFNQVTDLVLTKQRNSTQTWAWTDRIRGATLELTSSSSIVETAYSNDVTGFDNMTGFYFGSGASGQVNTSGSDYDDHLFKRAFGFFDEVCFFFSGTADIVYHNLGVVPELIIQIRRASSGVWPTYHSALGFSNTIFLNASSSVGSFSSVSAASNTTFTQGSWITGGIPGQYVAYLFATLAGISKVGSYTGNGTSQNIDCGFAAGARFFLVKATSTTSSWWVWDSARGITAGNDPALQLNSTAAEITTADAVDPYSPGITVNQEATCSINASGVSYIFLAVA